MKRIFYGVVVLAISALGSSACIVVPANNAAPPPPPPPPPDSTVYAPPPPPPPTPAPAYQPPPPPPPASTTTVVYYEAPPPEPVSYYESNVVWYYGPHPVTPGYGAGWCPIQGPHTHNYEPAWSDLYEFWAGYYYYIGDPWAYQQTVYYVYAGPHPNPWGGWCYVNGHHRHYYAPRRGDPYRFSASIFYYTGAYDHVYYEHRNDYDDRGHRRGNGNPHYYSDHDTYREQHPGSAHGGGGHGGTSTTATHEAGHNGAQGDARREEHGDSGLGHQGNLNGHEGNAHEGNGHEPPGHEAVRPNGHDERSLGTGDTTHGTPPANGGRIAPPPGHGNEHAAPANTPAPRITPAPRATATPAPANPHAGGGRIAPRATPAPAGRGGAKPTPTPTPAPHGRLIRHK